MGCVNETPLGRSPTFKQLEMNDRTDKGSGINMKNSVRITPLSSKVSSIMSSSRGIRVSKDFSLPEEQTIEEKRDQVKQLLFIKNKHESSKNLSVLLEYFLEVAELHKEDTT